MDLWNQDWEEHGDALQAALTNAGATEPDTAKSEELTADEYVQLMRDTLAATPFTLDSHAVDTTIEGVPCRIIKPESEIQCIYLHFHGGGMVSGAAFMGDIENRHLSNAFNLAVISVDYRLAPEFPFPAASEDSFKIARWLVDNAMEEFGTQRIIIGGESAGAYLALLTLLEVRESFGVEEMERFIGANLTFGIYDWSGTPSQLGNRPFKTDFDVLSPEIISFLTSQYLPGKNLEQRKDPDVSPMYANLTGLPDAYFCVGSADHLLDDTLFMANRWRASGNNCEVDVFPRAPHAFTMFPTPFVELHSIQRDKWFTKVLSKIAS